MAGIKVETEAEIELNLTTVQQLTRRNTSFGLENAGSPIFQWRLVDTCDNLKSKSKSSDFFPIIILNNNEGSDLTEGQLHLLFSKESQFKLTLNLIFADAKQQQDKSVLNSLNRFQLFICKFALRYSYRKELCDKCFFAMHVFNLNVAQNTFIFPFPNCFEATTISVELFQEPLALVEYRSPYNQMVVGKMEKVMETMEEKANFKGLFCVSPRLDFGSPDQLMMVGFRYSRYQLMAGVIGLSANLHIFSQSGARGLPFSFTVTFTIFSQRAEVKDSIYKIFYRRDENRNDFNILLAFAHELEPYLENDILYFKVHVEPRPFN